MLTAWYSKAHSSVTSKRVVRWSSAKETCAPAGIGRLALYDQPARSTYGSVGGYIVKGGVVSIWRTFGGQNAIRQFQVEANSTGEG